MQIANPSFKLAEFVLRTRYGVQGNVTYVSPCDSMTQKPWVTVNFKTPNGHQGTKFVDRKAYLDLTKEYYEDAKSVFSTD
jgi:hypothetical protein